MHIFRSILSMSLLFLLLLFVIAALNQTDLTEHSLINSNKIQADFEFAGRFTESFLRENDRVPTDTELKNWAKNKDFEMFSMESENGNPWIVEPGDTCGAAKEAKLPVEKRRYLLCYWRGEWVEEYSPETGATSVPSKLSDYDMTKQNWIELFAIILLVSGMAILVWPKRLLKLDVV